MRQWFYVHDGRQQGPIQKTKLVAMFSSGELQSNTLVWTEEFSEWIPAHNIENFVPAAMSPPPIPVEHTTQGKSTAENLPSNQSKNEHNSPSGFGWYIAVLKKYAVFSGRAQRKEYWMFVLFNTIIVFVLGFIEGFMGIAPEVDDNIIPTIYQFAVFIPLIAVGVRRMQDTDHNGWWLFFPIVNIVFACREGTKGDNRFGAAPPVQRKVAQSTPYRVVAILAILAALGLAGWFVAQRTPFLKDGTTGGASPAILSPERSGVNTENEHLKQKLEQMQILLATEKVARRAAVSTRLNEILQEGKEWRANLSNGVTMDLLPVGAGSFDMGSNDGDSDEKPVHRVTLTKPFWIGKYEVTQKQYEQVMGSNPSSFKGADNPVETVSWNEAMEFCKKLTEKEHASGRLPSDYKYTLPTEAQWEFAARGGKQSKGNKYSGSDNLDSVGWYDDNSGSKTHTVGQKIPNELGLYDMSGNVYEWCSDWYGDYPSGSVSDPVGASSGSFRVYRGGSWISYTWYCRSANRYTYTPTCTDYDLGFRLCLQKIDFWSLRIRVTLHSFGG